ncbi:MAG: HEAT repeat domain-containing protein [Candidatus Eremiobacteraeota bacterium]|nr:HEAT repeat domain-containing protein [Candidatus Eremiobacteraeota bacterium]
MQVWLQLGEAFARVSVGAILNSLWEALALALLAWLVLRLVPRANASLRYGLWCVALAAVLLLPVVALHAGAGAPAGGGSGADPAVAMPQRFAQFLFALWYVVATVLVLRLIVSYVRLQELKASARPLSPLYQLRVRRWLRESGGTRGCRLCVSDKVPMPVAIGLLDPVIVLPERLLDQLSEDELDQVGLHEVAHLQRWDDYTNVFQKVAEALCFFNPAVYLIGRQLTLEREIACDDRVIAATGRPLTYAACLTRLVEATALTRQALPALAALTTRRQFAIRIERLLDTKRGSLPLASGFAALAACVTMLAAVALASRVGPLVSVMPDSTHSRSFETGSIALSRHPAALAAVTAAVRPASIARRAGTAMSRIASVARSNAVGARNIIIVQERRTVKGVLTFVDKTVDVISAPPGAQPLALAPVALNFSDRIAMLDTHVQDVTQRIKLLKIRIKHVPTARSSGASFAYVMDSASAAFANADAAMASAEAPMASVEATDNVPVLVGQLPSLPWQSKVVVIGRLGDHLDSTEARAALVDAMLHDSSLSVKLHAVEALAEHVNETEPQAALIGALRESDSTNVKVAIIHALGDAITQANVPRGLEPAFGNSQPEIVQMAAAQALSDAAYDTEGQEALLSGLSTTTSSHVKAAIIRALADVAREPAVRRALQAELSPNEPVSVQLAAVQALAPEADDPEVRAALEMAGGNGCEVVRLSVKRALAEFGNP